MLDPKLRRVVIPALLGLLTLAGCGSDEGWADRVENSGILMKYEIKAGELDFNSGEPKDTVVPIPDASLVVQSDGHATYEFADQPKITYRMNDADLSELESAVNAVDFEEADAVLSGKTEAGLPAFSVTHDETTVELGDKFFGIEYGEGPRVADQMFDLLNRLDRLTGHVPGAEEATDEYIRDLERD